MENFPEYSARLPEGTARFREALTPFPSTFELGCNFKGKARLSVDIRPLSHVPKFKLNITDGILVSTMLEKGASGELLSLIMAPNPDSRICQEQCQTNSTWVEKHDLSSVPFYVKSKTCS